MKKITFLLIILAIAALIHHPLSASTEDAQAPTEKTSGKESEDHQLKLFHPYQNLFLQPVSLPNSAPPRLFSPDIPLEALLPAKKKTPGKRLGRAVLMGIGHFSYSTTSYWLRQDVMKEDWEYQFTWNDQRRRYLFIDGVRFDSNTFQFNWTHSLAGAIYHNYGRANHLNILESFLYGAVASCFWEFVVEFKEVVSVNDLIGTTIGGVSIGEALFQLGRHFRTQKPTFLNKIARFLSNPILSLSDFLDRNGYPEQYALENDYQSDCRLFTGYRSDTFANSDANAFLQVGLESRLNLIPGYGQPGHYSENITPPAFTEFNVNGLFNRGGLYELNIFAKSVFFGYFKQNLQQRAGVKRDYLKGYSFFVGMGSAFDFTEKNPAIVATQTPQGEEPGIPDRMDRHCIINILGPTIDLTFFHSGWKIHLNADAYGDFALIHSHAFKQYSQLHQLAKIKSTLENHDYYYGLGVSLSTQLEVVKSNVELKGLFRYHYFDSIEGLDRFQKEIPAGNDFDLKDQRWYYTVRVGYRIPGTPVQLVLGLEQWKRKGAIGTVEEHFARQSHERRSFLQIKYLF